MSTVNFETLRPLLESAEEVHGDFAEFGVYEGDTLAKIQSYAELYNKNCHAIDSFRGMGAPSMKDNYRYKKGTYDIGGPVALGSLAKKVIIWEGYVPEILDKIPNSLRLAFVHIDLDHFHPTLSAFEWCLLHMSEGGVIACHDYYEGADHLATPAIDKIANDYGLRKEGLDNSIVWFRISGTQIDKTKNTYMEKLRRMQRQSQFEIRQLQERISTLQFDLDSLRNSNAYQLGSFARSIFHKIFPWRRELMKLRYERRKMDFLYKLSKTRLQVDRDELV